MHIFKVRTESKQISCRKFFLQSTHDETIGVNEASERDIPLTHHRNTITTKRARDHTPVSLAASHIVPMITSIHPCGTTVKKANMENKRILASPIKSKSSVS